MDMLGDITSLIQISRRRVRRASSKMTKIFVKMFFYLIADCETELEKRKTLREHFQNVSVVLNKMNNTSIQAVKDLVTSLNEFVEEKLSLIEAEIRYFLVMEKYYIPQVYYI